MAIRFRRSIKLGPGVRLNVSKKSMGVSIGGRGIRYSVNTSGRTTRTIGVPGTGLSAVSTSKLGSPKEKKTDTREASRGDAAADLPRPGMFAPSSEKRFYEGVQAYIRGDLPRARRAFEAASQADSRNLSDDLFAGVVAHRLGDDAAAATYLEKVVASDAELPDPLMRKFLPPGQVDLALNVAITPRVTATVPFGSLGACLLLAEIYQAAGRLDDAIGLLQQLASDASVDNAFTVALCDLLFEDGDAEGVIEASNDLVPDSDLALAGLLLRGQAMAKLGLIEAACSVFTSALKKTAGRDKSLLLELRYQRALAYDALGKQAQAKRDLEKIFAERPDFLDVASRLGIATRAT